MAKQSEAHNVTAENVPVNRLKHAELEASMRKRRVSSARNTIASMARRERFCVLEVHNLPRLSRSTSRVFA
jgi:hypothetical protein